MTTATAVKFHGKVLEGKATLSQRVLLARLEGKTNFGQAISKADASRRIDKALAKGKTVKNGKAKALKLVGDATVSQRVLLHHLTGKDTRSLKLSKAEASAKIAKLLKK